MIFLLRFLLFFDCFFVFIDFYRILPIVFHTLLIVLLVLTYRGGGANINIGYINPIFYYKSACFYSFFSQNSLLFLLQKDKDSLAFCFHFSIKELQKIYFLNDTNMATRTLKPQECEWTYLFNGSFYATNTVAEQIPSSEIQTIINAVQALVKCLNGADYLQVFIDENWRKLFFIDNLNLEMKQSAAFNKEDDYCTLMFANEY